MEVNLTEMEVQLIVEILDQLNFKIATIEPVLELRKKLVASLPVVEEPVVDGVVTNG